METYVLEHSDEIIFNVHDPEKCKGQPCPVHNKTGHHLRHMPQHWHNDLNVIVRICEHGEIHPDPDDPSAFYVKATILSDTCGDLPPFSIRTLGLPEDLDLVLQDTQGNPITEKDGSAVVVHLDSGLTEFLLRKFYDEQFVNWLNNYMIQVIESAAKEYDH